MVPSGPEFESLPGQEILLRLSLKKDDKQNRISTKKDGEIPYRKFKGTYGLCHIDCNNCSLLIYGQ